MPATLPGQLAVEKSPSYFVTAGAARRVDDMTSSARGRSRDFRLLVVVRDPVTRALSDYAQSASKRLAPGRIADFRDLAFLRVSQSPRKTFGVYDVTAAS